MKHPEIRNTSSVDTAAVDVRLDPVLGVEGGAARLEDGVVFELEVIGG